MKRFVLLLFVVLFCVPEADARIFGRRRRSQSYSTSSYAFSGNAQQVAEQKANIQASRNAMFHPGGSFGGGNYEGVGAGATAQQALNNCCYTGQRVVLGQAVRQGSNGMWYACKIYR